MADDIDNLVLEDLRAIRTDIRDMKETLRDHTHGLARLEISMASLRRDRSGDAENIALIGIRVDRLAEDVARIKHHLELID
ncbi:hypothetical protein [Rhizobium sp. G21]|uniref:hypothetical protein n=1 Tax=Rhizobium sp. G21 TaxID=2758439 RepID=UPI00160466B0|nr:hypothetical protein [Rhizobium sp. G21]MBB1249992.1 hypothetical protein [Rhizobium sp. G21]